MGEEVGITRVQSSLELLSHTAELVKNDIEKNGEKLQTARVSPSESIFNVVSPKGRGSVSKFIASQAYGYPIDGSPTTESPAMLTFEGETSFLPPLIPSIPSLKRGEKQASLGVRPAASTGPSSGGSGQEGLLPSSSFMSLTSRSSFASMQAALAPSADKRNNVNSSVPVMDTFNVSYTTDPSYNESTAGSFKHEGSFRLSPSQLALAQVDSSFWTNVQQSINQNQQQPSSYQDMVNENLELGVKLAAKDERIADLEQKIVDLQKEVQDLRQLPTGKISQIPLEDMLDIMQTYGSELSENAIPPRKTNVQKSSVVRQFRRWNPHFFEHFCHKNGKWIPKLGRQGELKRRAQARTLARKNKASLKSQTMTNSSSTPPPPPSSSASLSQKSSTKGGAGRETGARDNNNNNNTKGKKASRKNNKALIAVGEKDK